MKMNMRFERKLEIPMEVKAQMPMTPELEATVSDRDRQIKAILSGQDKRLLLIIGPCSADREDSVLEYMHRLRRLSDEVRDSVMIVPRLYTTKPRTTGEGYKGILHQPDPTGKPDLFHGILMTRALHMKVLSETGFSCADEMLYPENYKYIDDLVAYAAVGARSVEDQQHRLTASGLEAPVGMKNPTSGDIGVMINAILAAQSGHSFIYRGWAAHSQGNPYAHGVLRGSNDTDGRYRPNYAYENLCATAEALSLRQVLNPALIVDTNHANSGKNADRQPEIIDSVMESGRRNPDVASLIKGFMVESYLVDGCQSPGGDVFGQSITDACLGWEKTQKTVLKLAESVNRN